MAAQLKEAPFVSVPTFPDSGVTDAAYGPWSQPQTEWARLGLIHRQGRISLRRERRETI